MNGTQYGEFLHILHGIHSMNENLVVSIIKYLDQQLKPAVVLNLCWKFLGKLISHYTS